MVAGAYRGPEVRSSVSETDHEFHRALGIPILWVINGCERHTQASTFRRSPHTNRRAII